MGEILFLVLLFVVGGLLQAAGKRRRLETPGTRPTGLESSGSGGMLAEIQKAIDEMKRAAEATAADEDDEVEAVSREVEPETRSLEDLTPRAERVIVDQDDAIEAIAAKRVEWAEARSRSHSSADHRAFDTKVRSPDAVVSNAPDRLAELRRMIVWQEVLGKPVSLRDREER